ncbi:MAG: ABC transporter ATP-binding protein [Pseudomonadota bacterium]
MTQPTGPLDKSPPSGPIFSIRGLRVSLPDMARKPLLGPAPRNRILKGLSFDLSRGETLGIVGGSGSGKSTLGRAMLRLVEASGGQVIFEGRDITHLPETALRAERRRMQMIFQDPMSSLNPRRTVAAIIAAPLRLHRLDDPADRVRQALDQVGLPAAFARRYPHELSGGQRQRVGIARAIALEPDFILADEIVSGLDVSSQAKILNLLETLVARLNLTLAFISHDLSVIRRLCTRTLVIDAGAIVEDAPTARLFETPQAPYTRDLLAAIPLPDPDQPGWAL